MNLFVIGISVGIELRCQRSCRLAEEDKGGAEVLQKPWDGVGLSRGEYNDTLFQKPCR